jgi:hypothetical protein
MKRTFTAFVLAALFGCREQTNTKRSSIQADTSKLSVNRKYQSFYKFDNTSFVSGCADVYLQKISRDLQYELMIELEFDSIPKFTELDVAKYSKFVKIYLNKYGKDNKYIDPICNDMPSFPKDWKQPTKFFATAGSLTITYWSGKESIVSALTKNLILEDSTKKIIILPSETFKELKVHWRGG